MSEQDHEVQEEKIMLVSLLMAELGVHSVAYAFPKVKIITTAVDKDLDESFHVIPGIGKQPHTFKFQFTHFILTEMGSSYLPLATSNAIISKTKYPLEELHAKKRIK